MKSKIILSDMEFYGFIGCLDEEKIIGTRFSVSVELLCDIHEAATEDDLTQTINYQSVYGIIKELMKERVNLLETMALRIINTLKDRFHDIERVTVSVSKLNPMLSVGGKIKAVTVVLNS